MINPPLLLLPYVLALLWLSCSKIGPLGFLLSDVFRRAWCLIPSRGLAGGYPPWHPDRPLSNLLSFSTTMGGVSVPGLPRHLAFVVLGPLQFFTRLACCPALLHFFRPPHFLPFLFFSRYFYFYLCLFVVFYSLPPSSSSVNSSSP